MKVEPNTMKRRLLLVQKLLYETTDEQHQITSFELIDFCAEHGIFTNRKTLKGDIDMMVECGMDIVTIQSKPNRYYWGKRSFEHAELKLLIDAVSSSRFISQSKSRSLVKKLISLASPYERGLLRRHIYATNRVKSSNENLLQVVDIVNDAISLKRQISFQYTDYLPTKKKVLKNNGEVYTLSPYALFWNEDYYYVVGFSEKHDNVSTFRIDRIKNIEITEERAAKKPDDYSIEKYSRQIFEMYDGGEITRVKLQCLNKHMKYIIDRFGEKVKTEIADDETFYAYVDVALSPTFYSWVFKFAGEIQIIEPSNAANEMKEMAQNLFSKDRIALL